MTHLEFLMQGSAGRLLRTYPYLGPLIYTLTFVEDAAVPTAATSRAGVMHINPKYATDTDEQRDAVLLHEALHPFLDYWNRMETRKPTLWNLAHDLEIASYTWPKACVKPEDFNLPQGLLAEVYYENLKGKVTEVHVGCGCDHLEPGDLSEDMQNAIIETATKISTAPGAHKGLQKRALEIINPFPPNNRLRQLQGSIFTSDMEDYSYGRMSRRQSVHRDVVVPALCHHVPHALCILDVSGSMDAHLTDATAAVLSAVQSIGAALDVVAWDTEIQEVCNVQSKKDLEHIKFTGGGTNMGAAILACGRRSRYDVILVVTDCETPWCEQHETRGLAPIKILRVGDRTRAVPEWMEVIEMSA